MTKKLLFTNNIEEQYEKELIAFDRREIAFIETKKVSINYELDIDVDFPVIITSKNAIWAVEGMKLVNNPLYIVGESTADKLRNKGYNVEAVGYDAFDLTSKLPAQTAYYLCGNRRRNTINDFYKDKDFDVIEVEVYETELTPHKINEEFDGVVFLSPSAVQSFYELNTIPDHTEIFSIGNTTTLELSQHTDRNVHEANQATMPALIECIKEVMFKNV